ncbi:nitroreductase family protein [Paenibacillus septentrionalis]|uniref:Nitroreductase family protein n=1 Tax=Paenibacillus septentrionalis TaxID=429342 RepID=A0ABW1VAU7_9BACL
MDENELRLLSTEERRKYYFEKNYRYDANLYYRYSGTVNSKFTKEAHKSELIFYYHKIEKGLSLKNIRPFFGVNAVDYLIDSLYQYVEKYGFDHIAGIAYGNIKKYFDFHKNLDDNGLLLPLKDKFNKLIGTKVDINIISERDYGINIIKKSDVQIENNFKELCFSRHTIRQFTEENVELETIYKAVEIAQTTPSVCNRQASRIHIIEDKKIMEDALRFQNGNTGFENDINKLLVVTSELNDFKTSNERNQPYIDGGMYAMTLIYALHSLGLGTCPLNLALDSDLDMELKKEIDIPENQVLIMMIALGHIPEKLPVAASKKLAIEEVVRVVN